MTTKHYFGQRNTWGLTMKRGPWKVDAKDNAFAIGDQTHAGHLAWKTVERPAQQVDQYKIPQFINNSIKYYGGGDYIPNTRPGRIQYASPRDQIPRNYGITVSNITPVSTQGEGQNHFQVGGDGNNGSPDTSMPSIMSATTSSGRPSTTGSFHIEDQNVFDPYGGGAAEEEIEDWGGTGTDPIDDLAPPTPHNRNPYTAPLEDLRQREEESTVNESIGIIQNTNAANLLSIEVVNLAEAMQNDYPEEDWTQLFSEMSEAEIYEAINTLAAGDGPGGLEVEPVLPAGENPNPRPSPDFPSVPNTPSDPNVQFPSVPNTPSDPNVQFPTAPTHSPERGGIMDVDSTPSSGTTTPSVNYPTVSPSKDTSMYPTVSPIHDADFDPTYPGIEDADGENQRDNHYEMLRFYNEVNDINMGHGAPGVDMDANVYHSALSGMGIPDSRMSSSPGLAEVQSLLGEQSVVSPTSHAAALRAALIKHLSKLEQKYVFTNSDRSEQTSGKRPREYGDEESFRKYPRLGGESNLGKRPRGDSDGGGGDMKRPRTGNLPPPPIDTTGPAVDSDGYRIDSGGSGTTAPSSGDNYVPPASTTRRRNTTPPPKRSPKPRAAKNKKK